MELKINPENLVQQYNAIMVTPPTAEDISLSESLQEYMDEHFPLESEINIKRRSVILAELRQMFRKFVTDIAVEKGLPREIAEEAGGLIYVSGSYRLGVNEPGADIDTICIAPRHVERSDFFTSLKQVLLMHGKVSNLVSIEEAIVPLITFDYEEINIDLQIAILPLHTVPESLNILDDAILKEVDIATEKSLNGPRVTELMIKLTPNRESFIKVLRVVRRWAKRRGLYSNKMGYLGGINWCILTCFINQLYPTAAPATLLLKFFVILSTWKWPAAIQLCKTMEGTLGLEVWNTNNVRNRNHIMPILTPAYPSMNSSYSVSTLTLAVMKEEFNRGLEIVKEITDTKGQGWEKLFEISDFFAVHQNYLAVDMYAGTMEDQLAWCGYGESRLRKLVESLAYIPQLQRIRAFPKKFPLAFMDAQDHFGVSFFVAFDINRAMLRNNKEIRIDDSVSHFKDVDLYRWAKRVEGMEVKITPIKWKGLPDFVFEDLGGKEAAKLVRRDHMKRKKEELVAAAAALEEAKKIAVEANKRSAQTALEEAENPTKLAKLSPGGSATSADVTVEELAPPVQEKKQIPSSVIKTDITSQFALKQKVAKKKNKMKISFTKKK